MRRFGSYNRWLSGSIAGLVVRARWASDPRVHALTGSNPDGHTFDNLDFERAFSLAEKKSKSDEPFLDGSVSALV